MKQMHEAHSPSRDQARVCDPAVGALVIASIRYLQIRSRQVALEFAKVREQECPKDAPPYPSPLADLEETRAAANQVWQELEALLARPSDPRRPEPGPVASRLFDEEAPPSTNPRYGEDAMADADQLRVQILLERASASPDQERIAHLKGLHEFYLSIGKPDYWDRWLTERTGADGSRAGEGP